MFKLCTNINNVNRDSKCVGDIYIGNWGSLQWKDNKTLTYNKNKDDQFGAKLFRNIDDNFTFIPEFDDSSGLYLSPDSYDDYKKDSSGSDGYKKINK